MKRGTIRIGTSGIALPASMHASPIEFRDKSRLTYYASLFNTLEINSTFKKLPRLSTFDKWRNEVPRDFLFTIKLQKDFTHVKKLETDFENLHSFLDTADSICNKKGCLLVQFPASITAAFSDRVEQLLQKLNKADPKKLWLKAIEFRSVTWYNNETFNQLKQHNASMVLQDMPKSNNLSIEQPFPFFYFRYHGPKGDYKGSYSDAFLEEQAEKMKRLLSIGKDVYAYFNNTMGDAYANAMYLKKLLEKAGDQERFAFNLPLP
jgi:uncharacterized protein YecE (DUF72 family)